jgi:hypothetical protein
MQKSRKPPGAEVRGVYFCIMESFAGFFTGFGAVLSVILAERLMGFTFALKL